MLNHRNPLQISFLPPKRDGRGRIEGGRATSLRLPVSPAARRFDDEDVAGRHLGIVGAAESLDAPVLALNIVAPQRPRLAAGRAIGRHAAVAGEDGRGHRLAEAYPADYAVAAAMAAAPAAAAPDAEALHQHRKAPFENLRVGQPRIGHMGMYGVGAVEI